MRLGDLTAGQPFRAALRLLAVFLLIYLAAGWGLVRAVSGSLRAELLAQARSESLLLEEIYQTAGVTGLTEALADMERHYRLRERTAGAFDANRLSLAGPISVFPDVVGVTRQDMRSLTGGQIDGTFFLTVREVNEVTLVVGRSTRPLDLARARLVSGLIAFGLVLSAAILVLGLWASRTSFRRLQAMEAALRAVAAGDSAARLPVWGTGDQFDRVSVQMNANLDRLDRLMAGMKATAAAIAHDLKTPLSHAQIKLYGAADACEAGQDPLPQIEEALAETEALNAVFDAVLRISRIQSSDQSSFARVDLGELAQKVAEFMTPLAEANTQALRLDTAAAGAVFGDVGMIQQALVNLVKNAVTHAGVGATIAMTARGTTLAVRDDGPGVPEADLSQLLAPFARADAARTTPGSGLGLALVQAVADRHGAQVVLHNARPGFTAKIAFPPL